MGGRRIVWDSDDDTADFPSPPPTKTTTRVGKAAAVETPRATAKEAAAPKSTVRRRKLGPIQNDNALLQAWKVDGKDEKDEKPSRARPRAAKAEKQPKKHVELRTRRTRRISELPADDDGEISTEEATVLEDVHLGKGEEEGEDDDDGEEEEEEEEDNDDEEDYEDDDNDNDSSEFQDSPDDSDSDDSLGDFFPSPALKKHIPAPAKKNPAAAKKKSAPRPPSPPPDDSPDQSSLFFSAEETLPDPLDKPLRQRSLAVPAGKAKTASHDPPPRSRRAAPAARPSTPPPPASPPRGLVSPSKKLPRIPMTPHAPSADAFWDQQFVDDWNTEHSPRKLFQEAKPEKPETTKAKTAKPGVAAREAKKTFQKSKHETAERFLAELDGTITQGELARLAATTGGVRIVWTNKLNTTAGRANWRRETLRPKGSTSGSPLRILHHASIELAEKVIDDEHRLLNVLAHEFCHLANFMVSGITGNPHGREFKAWAAQCSRHFGARGIQVTTKHTYEIDFRYVWTCAACATQYKRHSKSIDPRRHRCGLCRGELQQTKPVPRTGGKAVTGSRTGTGTTPGTGSVAPAPKLPPAPSAYQLFMKENMAVLRRENPGSPQKEIMKMVAERWTQAKKDKAAASGETGKKDKKTDAGDADGVTRLDKAFVDLTLT